MKTFVRSKRFRVLLACAGFLCGAWALGAAWDGYKVMKMTEKLKTVCMGRMLIDLPQEAQVELRGQRIDAFDIETFLESPEAFQARILAREAEIRAKPDRLGGKNNLEMVREVRTEAGLSGKIFVHGREVDEGYSSDGFTREDYRYEGIAMEAHVQGKGISIDMSVDFYYPDRLEFFLKLLSQLVANPDNHIPTEPGFCLDRAYMREPLSADQSERITMWVKLPSNPDIDITFDSIAGIDPAPQGLLERSKASRARFPAILNARVTDLRAAPRTLGGLLGDELVQRVIEDNFTIVYGFQWEVNGTVDNVFVPTLRLEMVTGRGEAEPVRSSLAEPAALALWDRIASSVRIRPASAAQAATATPLGVRASAGQPCPHSGWWECGSADGAMVHGGARRFFQQGARMPQALLLQKNMWEKIRGVQPSHQTVMPTVWTLADRRERARLASAVALAEAKSGLAGDVGAASPALGMQAMTGSTCPASGWWRCEEAEALDGARWFAQGSLLPPATFAVPERAFGKPGRAPRTIQRRVGWRLMRQDPASAGEQPA